MKKVIRASRTRRPALDEIFILREESYEIEEGVISKYYLVDRDDMDEDVMDILAEIGADRGDYEFNGQEYAVVAQYALDSADHVLDGDELEILNSIDFSSFISIDGIEV